MQMPPKIIYLLTRLRHFSVSPIPIIPYNQPSNLQQLNIYLHFHLPHHRLFISIPSPLKLKEVEAGRAYQTQLPRLQQTVIHRTRTRIHTTPIHHTPIETKPNQPHPTRNQKKSKSINTPPHRHHHHHHNPIQKSKSKTRKRKSCRHPSPSPPQPPEVHLPSPKAPG